MEINLESKDYTQKKWMLFLQDYRTDLNKFIKNILADIQLLLGKFIQ